MADETSQRMQLLATEIIEALGTILQKKKPLDAQTLSESLLERPMVLSFLEETAVEKTDLNRELEKKDYEFKELSKKYDEALKDLQYNEVQARDIEEALKELALTLSVFATNSDEPLLEKELHELKEIFKKRTIPSRIISSTKELKKLLFKIDSGAFEQEFPGDEKDDSVPPEDIEDNVRDILTALVKELTSFEESHLQEQAQTLARKIASDFTFDNFEPYFQEIFELIIKFKEVLYNKRQELYRFSQEVMVHLQETEKALLKTLDSNREHLMTLEVDFEMRVAEDMQEIEQSFALRGKSLDEIRNTVLDSIGSIRRHFLEKRADDEARIKQAEQEKGTIQKRLRSVNRRYQEFTRQSKAALENAERFKKASLRDRLTDAYNRRAYDFQIKKTLEDFQRGLLNRFSLIVFDIDEFRNINNNYGHRAGDKILMHVARLTAESLREDDFLARIGGDEFVIILPDSKLKDAAKIANKIRTSIGRVEFKIFRDRDLTINVSLSLGVATGRKDDTPDDIFVRADQALYQAKGKGRNQVQTE
ncbi:MAG: diguanylate cyclase [Deltaproteobacteria bacterium]|nr:diguanylate cyclase [Deltaproteobacteria bacterium]MBW2051363.1 diguanylate cyclase [Deltaproteobacteria bacterium]MBW2139988.1 diguanylate cyclase [Deltaproteobacteria bacterium]MBW2322656.1 diguanylate cyclase [Deltaproteobacteria bacterium]